MKTKIMRKMFLLFICVVILCSYNNISYEKNGKLENMAEYLENPEKSMTFLYNSEIISADILLQDGDILTFGDI